VDNPQLIGRKKQGPGNGN